MRNFCQALWFAVGSTILFTLIYVIYGVLSQPLFAAEKAKILEPGYMPKSVEAPRIDSKRFSRSEGYLYTPETGTTQHVEIRSYRNGPNTIYTVRVAPESEQVTRVTPERFRED